MHDSTRITCKLCCSSTSDSCMTGTHTQVVLPRGVLILRRELQHEVQCSAALCLSWTAGHLKEDADRGLPVQRAQAPGRGAANANFCVGHRCLVLLVQACERPCCTLQLQFLQHNAHTPAFTGLPPMLSRQGHMLASIAASRLKWQSAGACLTYVLHSHLPDSI